MACADAADPAHARCRAASDQALKAGQLELALQTQQGGGYDQRRNQEVLDGRNMMTLAQALLAKGADVNAQMERPPARLRLRRKPLLNLTGATPFMLAAAAGDIIAMRTLVEARAKPLISTVVDQKEFLKALAAYEGAQADSAQKMHGMGEVTYTDKSGAQKKQRMQLAGGRWKLVL